MALPVALSLIATIMFYWNSSAGLSYMTFAVNMVALALVIYAWITMLNKFEAPAVVRTRRSGLLGGLGRSLSYLFLDWRSLVLWIPLRAFLAYDWIEAGTHELLGTSTSPSWLWDGGGSLLKYWKGATAIPTQGSPRITYDFWREVLNFMAQNGLAPIISWMVAWGELLIGLGILFGGLLGIACFFGITLNTFFLLSGSTSSNPILLVGALLLIGAYRVAGQLGLDHKWLKALDPTNAPEITPLRVSTQLRR
jgi:thiosulfate dehydrogenase [quinone] large subunit